MKKILVVIAALLAVFSCDKNSTDNREKDYTVPPVNSKYVDLGLPSGTLWAPCNVGATKPQEIGGYFSFGETEPKTEFYARNYKFYNDGKYTKYTKDDYLLEAVDDITYNVKTDKGRHMPTCDEWLELAENSVVTYETIDGILCAKLTSKTNGNYILLPCAGTYGPERNNDESKPITGHTVNTAASYWCADYKMYKYDNFSPERACIMIFSNDQFFHDGSIRNQSTYKSWGRPVRACCYPSDFFDVTKIKDTIKVNNYSVKEYVEGSLNGVQVFDPQTIEFSLNQNKDKFHEVDILFNTVDSEGNPDYNWLFFTNITIDEQSTLTSHDASITFTKFDLSIWGIRGKIAADKVVIEYDTDGLNYSFSMWNGQERILYFTN